MKLKIIIADDDPGVQDIFKIIFEKAGYETMVFSGGEPILEGLYELPDVFLLDKQLCGTDGLEICKHLKNNLLSRNIPVILVSATPDLAKLAKEAGADDYIEKPFSTRALLEKVKGAIDKRAVLHNEERDAIDRRPDRARF